MGTEYYDDLYALWYEDEVLDEDWEEEWEDEEPYAGWSDGREEEPDDLEEPDNLELGFNPYMGCYDYDC